MKWDRSHDRKITTHPGNLSSCFPACKRDPLIFYLRCPQHIIHQPTGSRSGTLALFDQENYIFLWKTLYASVQLTLGHWDIFVIVVAGIIHTYARFLCTSGIVL